MATHLIFTGKFSLQMANMVAITEHAPAQSPFISFILAAGLMDIPPLS